MDLDKVQALLRLVNESGVAEVEVEEDGFRLVIRRQATTVMMQPPMAGYPMQQGYPPPMSGYPMQQGFPPQQGFPMQTGYPPMPPSPAEPEPTAAATEPGSGDGEVLVRAPIVGTF